MWGSKKHPLQNRTNVQIKGGGAKGLLNNVQNNCTFLSGWLPLSWLKACPAQTFFAEGLTMCRGLDPQRTVLKVKSASCKEQSCEAICREDTSESACRSSPKPHAFLDRSINFSLSSPLT